MQQLILAINPGSTSTKIAVFNRARIVFQKNIKHSTEELSVFDKVTDQFIFRRDAILNELKMAKIYKENIRIVVGRGGLIRPVESGVYRVNQLMKTHLKEQPLRQHASNLGALLADNIAADIPNSQACIADPIVVDEMDDIARITGHPLFERKSIFHALNQKAVGRLHARTLGFEYNKLNLIIAHLGGGITIGAHKKGRVIDVNQGLDGDGPFTPDRTGTLPVGDLVDICFSGEYTKEEIRKMITGNGGYMAYFGSNNAGEIEEKALNGNSEARKIRNAMTYQIAKEIGAMAVVLNGDVDGILLTGGIAYNEEFVESIKERIKFIAKIFVYPGEDEMRALAMNGLMVLNKEIEPKEYQG